ncbi:hypothetical protein AB1J28_22865 [Lysinibacillus irui]
MTRKVLVIGLGLIGGSIALALQKAPETKIIAMIWMLKHVNKRKH